MTYLRFTWELPATAQDLVTAELWSLDTLGVELHAAGADRVRMTAYFPASPALQPLGSEQWHARGVRLLERVEMEDRDWLLPFRERSRPFAVGKRFLVDPGEPDRETRADPGGGTLLRLPARRAFGIGSHASTRLAIELLEACPPRGLRVLDVGTGTGILAFAALRLGASSVVGLDIDPSAIFEARENARLNGLAPGLVAGRLAAIGTRLPFQVALVNIIPEKIVPELQALRARLVPGARVVASGMLHEKRQSVVAELRRLGFEVEEGRQEEEWIAVALIRTSGG